MKVYSNVKIKSCEKLILLVIISFLLFPPLTLAVEDTVTVSVSVAAVAQISVIPESLSWSNINPGSAGTAQYLNIINTGSVNVTNIYAYVDTLTDEAERPYGKDDPTKYAAGGVIVFKNETDSTYFFAGRIEWNWTEDVGNKDLSNINSPVAWGFFKNTSFEYFWALGNGTNGYCNNTGAQFAIEDDVDNGTVETRTPTTSNIQLDSGDVNWGYFSVNRATAPLYGSCVAAYYDCTKIYIYKYDKRSGFTSCANSRYIQAPNLVPGETHTLTLRVYVPYGIPDGSLSTATFTVYASG
ncbi:MAG: hypothetical protein QW040_00045 [Candidatus Aenigmatarchaeota archaeon]